MKSPPLLRVFMVTSITIGLAVLFAASFFAGCGDTNITVHTDGAASGSLSGASNDAANDANSAAGADAATDTDAHGGAGGSGGVAQ